MIKNPFIFQEEETEPAAPGTETPETPEEEMPEEEETPEEEMPERRRNS